MSNVEQVILNIEVMNRSGNDISSFKTGSFGPGYLLWCLPAETTGNQGARFIDETGDDLLAQHVSYGCLAVDDKVGAGIPKV